MRCYHEGRLPTVVKDLDVRVTFHSRNVLSTLRDLSDGGSLASCKWVEEVADRGRNVIKLREATQREPTATAAAAATPTPDDEDRFSVAESDVTMLVR